MSVAETFVAAPIRARFVPPAKFPPSAKPMVAVFPTAVASAVDEALAWTLVVTNILPPVE